MKSTPATDGILNTEEENKMNLPAYYNLNILGTRMRLPLIVSEEEGVALYNFNLMGKTRINLLCAEGIYEIIKKNGAINDIDCLVAIEAKSLALAQELSGLIGFDEHIVIRKGKKIYMKDPLTEAVKPDDSPQGQELVLDGVDADRMKGKNVLVVEDLVSTGKTIKAAARLIERAGARLYGVSCVATEGKRLENEKKYIRLGHIPRYSLSGEMI